SKVRLTDTERTLTRISPAAGVGVGTSSRRKTSGPPNPLRTMAFISVMRVGHSGRDQLSSVAAARLINLLRTLTAQRLEEAALFQLIIDSGVDEFLGFAPLGPSICLCGLCEDHVDGLVREVRRFFDEVRGVFVGRLQGFTVLSTRPLSDYFHRQLFVAK